MPKLHYDIMEMKFGESSGGNGNVVFSRGKATCRGQKYMFELTLALNQEGIWKAIKLRWFKKPHRLLKQPEFKAAIIKASTTALDTINMWPEEQLDGAARLALNQYVIPPENDGKVIICFRTGMLNFPTVPWEELWDRIEKRVLYDDQFRVLGIDDDTVLRLLPKLKQIFPYEWVRARYREAGLSSMNGAIEPTFEGWFPAYQLARTAQGAICRDPGWN